MLGTAAMLLALAVALTTGSTPPPDAARGSTMRRARRPRSGQVVPSFWLGLVLVLPLFGVTLHLNSNW